MASLPHQPMYKSTGTTQTAGARNKGDNFIGQLCISVVPHWIRNVNTSLLSWIKKPDGYLFILNVKIWEICVRL